MTTEFYCNKCGYLGPESDHKRPGDGAPCYYLAAPIDGVIAVDESKALEKRRLKLAKRRERIATAAMQGLLVDATRYDHALTELAVQYADALIAELDK